MYVLVNHLIAIYAAKKKKTKKINKNRLKTKSTSKHLPNYP